MKSRQVDLSWLWLLGVKKPLEFGIFPVPPFCQDRMGSALQDRKTPEGDEKNRLETYSTIFLDSTGIEYARIEWVPPLRGAQPRISGSCFFAMIDWIPSEGGTHSEWVPPLREGHNTEFLGSAFLPWQIGFHLRGGTHSEWVPPLREKVEWGKAVYSECYCWCHQQCRAKEGLPCGVNAHPSLQPLGWTYCNLSLSQRPWPCVLKQECVLLVWYISLKGQSANLGTEYIWTSMWLCSWHISCTEFLFDKKYTCLSKQRLNFRLRRTHGIKTIWTFGHCLQACKMCRNLWF